MKKCPNCDHDLPDSAIKCKYCDYKFEPMQGQIPEIIPDAASTRSITDKYQVQNRTKKCNHCAMEIPIDASICPYCRKSTNRLTSAGESMMNTGKKITTFVFSLVIIGLILFCVFSVLN